MPVLNTADKLYLNSVVPGAVYCGVTKVWPTGYKSTILADNPVIYWRLDETAGPTATDLSGHGNNGTYGGPSLQFSQPGALTSDNDTAVFLNSGGYISSTWPYPVGGKLSLEGWAKTPPGVNPAELLMCSTVNGTVPNLWFDTPTQLVWYPRNASGLLWNVTWPQGQWMHFIVTWDDAAQVGRLYLNSSDLGAGTWAHGTAQSFGTPYNFEAGAVANALGPWPGYMDEVAVYNYILTAAQAAKHYQAGTS